MNTVTTTRLINADINLVWAQIKDVNLIQNWHPGVASTDKLSDKSVGIGATRRCNFYKGNSVVEKIVELDEQANSKRLKIVMSEFNAPMHNFSSVWEIKSTGSGATQITIKNNYEMKLSILGTVLDLLIIRGKMPKLLNKVLSGLEHHVIHGEMIGEDFTEATARVKSA